MSAIKKIFVSSSFHESFELGFNDERKLLKDKINGEDDLTDNSLAMGLFGSECMGFVDSYFYDLSYSRSNIW